MLLFLGIWFCLRFGWLSGSSTAGLAGQPWGTGRKFWGIFPGWIRQSKKTCPKQKSMEIIRIKLVVARTLRWISTIYQHVVHHDGYNTFRLSSLFHDLGTQKNTKVGSLENLSVRFARHVSQSQIVWNNWRSWKKSRRRSRASSSDQYSCVFWYEALQPKFYTIVSNTLNIMVGISDVWTLLENINFSTIGPVNPSPGDLAMPQHLPSRCWSIGCCVLVYAPAPFDLLCCCYRLNYCK